MALVPSLVLVAAPRIAAAQAPGKVYRIGVLGGTGPEVSPVLRGFIERLRELGYAEDQNLVIEGRYYGDRVDRLPALAAELVRVQVDVIVAGAPPAPEAAKSATAATPIVLTGHPDPVGSGLVASLARPGGNVTGVSGVGHEFRGKQLQLLKDALPSLGHVAVLSDPTNRFHARELKEVDVAARALKLRVGALEARLPDDFAAAVAAAARERAGALVVLGGRCSLRIGPGWRSSRSSTACRR
jgi:ABC-type uncharacterized transport system substrate-binding protein